MGSRLIIWLLVCLWGGTAAAQELPWYVGLPVAQVSFEGPEGGLPLEDLSPLLRSRQGEVLDPGLVRDDVHVLVRAGEFASVDVYVMPWILSGEGGEAVDAVHLIYQVRPAPRIGSIVLEGAAGDAKKIVESALGMQLGAVFFPEEGLVDAQERVRARLQADGWLGVKVTVSAPVDALGQIQLGVEVALGEPRAVGSIRIDGDRVIPQRKMLRWLRTQGVKLGHRLSDESIRDAQAALIDRLAEEGWAEARVNIVTSKAEDGPGRLVRVLVAAGRRVQVTAQGKGLPSDSALQEIMGLRPGARLSPRALSDAAERVEDWYAERGYLDAKVEIYGRPASEGRQLFVQATRGPRHQVQQIRILGAEQLGARSVRVAVRDADADGYGRGLIVSGGAARAEAMVKELYRGAGHLSAQVSVKDQPRTTGGLARLSLRYRVANTVEVTVKEGPQTRLRTLSLRAPTLGVEALFEERRAALEGAALNPGALDDLLDELIDAIRDLGYLDASGELDLSFSPDREQSTAEIVVEPGEKVLLRSIVIRGNTRTQRHVISRELALEKGGLITPRRVDQTRAALYDLEIFRYVRPELMGEDPRSRDLLLQVEERRNIVMEAGGGVSTDEGLLARSRVTHRNLWGLGQRASLLGQVGYGWMGDEWSLDTAVPVWRAAARYELPYVPGRGHRLVLEGLLKETVQEPTWRLSRSGVSASLKMRLSAETELVFDYTVQSRRLEDVDPGALVNGDPWVPLLGLSEDLSGDVLSTSNPLVFSGGSILVYRDWRNDRFAPTSGGTSSTQLEMGDGAISGVATVRGTTRMERLVPLGPFVLGVVGSGGLGWAEGRSVTLPLEDRFYLGGGRTLRGFSLNSVGPANLTSRPEVPFPSQVEPVVDGLSLRDMPAHWVATGGDSFAAFTLELQVPMPVLGLRQLDGTSLVLFTDAGYVGFIDPAVITTSALQGTDPPIRGSFGTGIRIATPIGPASFDVGINPNPITERGEAWILPHLSLGVL